MAEITVTYVLPVGKTMEDYENQTDDQTTSRPEDRPAPDKDDSWLE